MIRPLIALAALSIALPAAAQRAEPPKRIRNVTLTGTQTCPPAVGDEVVVCARIPADEQYRIPKELRSEGPIPVERQSWAAKTERLDEVGREAGGLPNTCSPSGSGGHTGCTAIMLERARADKRAGTTNPPR